MSQWPGITWRGYASFWGVIRRSIEAKYYIVVIVIQSLSHVWLFCDLMDCSIPGFPVLHYLQSLLNSCPLSKWCYPTISSSVTLFSSCLQSFPALASSPKSWVFTSGSQSIWNFSISLSNEYSGLISLRTDWFDLAVQGTLKSLLQHHNLNALRCMSHLPHFYLITWTFYNLTSS